MATTADIRWIRWGAPAKHMPLTWALATRAVEIMPGLVEAREGLDAVETRLRQLRRSRGG